MQSKNRFIKAFHQQKYLYLLLLPSLILVILFSYAPMTGVYMAFTNYTPTNEGYFNDLFSAPWVGLTWFEDFFTRDFDMIMRNTLLISILSLVISFPIPIVIAILINEVKTGWIKRPIQTASYLPYFISWAIAANMVFTMLGSQGIINDLLIKAGIIDEPISFFLNGEYFAGIIASLNTWKGMGYNSIIFLASIAGIPQEQFEASKIDGATRWQNIFYITLPSLKNIIMIMLILAMGGILNAGFEQILLLQNSAIRDYSDVIDVFAYNFGITQGMYSYGAAVGLFRSVVTFALVMLVNFISGKVSDSSLY